VPREELFKKIREASLVVLPSIHEAQPVSMLEAMACKKPVVAFDFPFSNELVQNMYNGLLAKSGDVKDLSDKIRLLLTDRQLRLDLGQNAYEYVEKSHNWDTLAEKYIELYLGKA
jgi:N,N'-diacetylbacillosaminyl-diphospho-undecaprenol alpha-1,3-N-acetylgalactosaminyltransferase